MFGGVKSVMAEDGKRSAGDCQSLPLAGKREKYASSTTFLSMLHSHWRKIHRIHKPACSCEGPGVVAGATAWDEDTARRFAIKKIAKGCWHAAEVPRETCRRITLVPKFGAAAVGQYYPASPFQVA